MLFGSVLFDNLSFAVISPRRECPDHRLVRLTETNQGVFFPRPVEALTQWSILAPKVSLSLSLATRCSNQPRSFVLRSGTRAEELECVVVCTRFHICSSRGSQHSFGRIFENWTVIVARNVSVPRVFALSRLEVIFFAISMRLCISVSQLTCCNTCLRVVNNYRSLKFVILYSESLLWKHFYIAHLVEL